MWQYDLYICSTEQDAAWAEELGMRIKNYMLPKNVDLPDGKLGYKNIHIDTKGQAFTEETKALLDSCRYMLVICSPRTKNDQSILERLLYFEKTREKSNIIAVIIEGEPIDSFPPFFIEEKMTPHILPDGSIEERLEIIEPVASDLRGENKKHISQLFRYETVRIVASVLGMAPDALEQRHNRRRKHRIIAISAILCAILLSVSVIFGYFGLKALHEGQIADLQTQESLIVSKRLLAELPAEFADDPKALEYVYETILDAVYALYETGSVNFSEVNAEQVLEISDEDSALTMLRKASLLRIFKSENAMAAYEVAADAFAFSEEDKNLFIERMRLFSSGTYGHGMYVQDGAGGINKGDIIILVNNEEMSGIPGWKRILSELISEDVTVTVLRPDASKAAVISEELTVNQSALGGISALGV